MILLGSWIIISLLEDVFLIALLRELSRKTAVRDAEQEMMELINVLVEKNIALFESKKRANAAATTSEKPSSKPAYPSVPLLLLPLIN